MRTWGEKRGTSHRTGPRHASARLRSAWMKMRVNRAHEFVIRGYTRGTTTFDALIFGYYEGDPLIYAAEREAASRPPG